MERISLAEVRHVAQLARLQLSDEELAVLQGELSSLLDHVEAIVALPTEGVAPTAHPLPLSNVLRPDVPGPCLEQRDALAAAPEAAEGRFLVPRILGEAP